MFLLGSVSDVKDLAEAYSPSFLSLCHHPLCQGTIFPVQWLFHSLWVDFLFFMACHTDNSSDSENRISFISGGPLSFCKRNINSVSL